VADALRVVLGSLITIKNTNFNKKSSLCMDYAPTAPSQLPPSPIGPTAALCVDYAPTAGAWELNYN